MSLLSLSEREAGRFQDQYLSTEAPRLLCLFVMFSALHGTSERIIPLCLWSQHSWPIISTANVKRELRLIFQWGQFY